MRSLLSIFLVIGSAFAQTPLCSRDSSGNQVCASAQTDTNVCGYGSIMRGLFPSSYFCADVVVQKTAPDGSKLYTRVLGGESQDQPSQLFLDAQGDAIVVGATWSTKFPTTPDAAQPKYAGPPPVLPSGSAIQGGGDLFLCVLSPTGDLLYSTFLGSTGIDTLVGARTGPGSQIDLLIRAGAGGFVAATPWLAGGPVLLTFDTSGRTIVRSLYLPIGLSGASVSYSAAWRDDGTIGVITARSIFTFQRDGQLANQVSLASFAFQYAPSTTTDAAGDLWLVGYTTAGQYLVARLVGGVVEAFRWTLPAPSNEAWLYSPPFFGPDGRAYFSGTTRPLPPGSLTPNAILTAPCSSGLPGLVAVLSAQGELKLLSYLPGPVSVFAVNPDGSVSAILYGSGGSVRIDLESHPKLACVNDPFRSYASAIFGAGQIVRLLGGDFGPSSSLAATLGADNRFPKSLDGLSVQVAGIDAPILSASAGEVIFAIPFGAPEGDHVPVAVIDHGERSSDLGIAIRALSPQAISPILNGDYSVNSYASPARWGSPVTIFVTGAGQTNPPLDDGQIAPADAPHLAVPVTVSSFSILSPTAEPGTVLYAGAAPGLIAGLTQINIQVPPARPLPYDSITVYITIGGVPLYLGSIYVQ